MSLWNIERLPDAVGASGVAALVGAALGAGRNMVVLLAVLSAIAVILGLDFGRTLRAGGFALVALSATSLVLGNLRPSFEVPGVQVSVLVVAFAAISYFTDALPGRTRSGGRYLIGPTFILWFFFQDILQIERSDALVRVAGDYAEDNAAWLLGLGHSSRDATSVLSLSSNVGGGPSTGSILVFIRDVMSRLTSEQIVGLADNPRVLMTAYVMMAIASALLLAHLCEQATEHCSPWLRHSLSCLSTAMFVPFSLALMKVGHFSASVAVFFLVVAVTSAMTMRTEPQQGLTLQRLVSVLAALVAMGQAWYPLTGVAMLFLLLVVMPHLAQWWRKTPPSLRVRKLIPMCLICFLLVVVVARRLFSTYWGNITDLDYLRSNLRLAGGYAPVNPLVFVAATLGMLISVSAVNRTKSLLPQIVHATTVPLLALLCISFLMTPNTPQYGVLKAIFILSSVYVPLASVTLLEFLSNRISTSTVPVASAVIWCVMMFFSPPGNEIKWLSNPGDKSNDWAKAIVKEADAGRSVVCLNTELDNTSRDYEAYLCTRIASSVVVKDTYETRTWTAANLCQIPANQAADAFTKDFQESLTIIIFDASRLSSRTGCQAAVDGAPRGWLSSIDWNVVKVVDTKGDPVAVDDGMLSSQEET